MAKRASTYQLLRVVQTAVPLFRREPTASGQGFTTRGDGTKRGTVIIFVDPEHPALAHLAARALRSKSGLSRALSGAIKAQVQSHTVTAEGREP